MFTYDPLLNQIEKLSLLKNNRDIIKLLSGLDLELYRADGTPLHCSSSKTSPSHHIKPAIVEEIQESKAPAKYIDEDRFKKIAIPIVLNDDVIGILFTGENKNFSLQLEQWQSIAKTLDQFTHYIIKNELTPLNINLFKDNIVTHKTRVLNEAIKYIKNNFHSNTLSLKEISDQNNISYHHLSRIFKKELNTTFAKFRNKIRMDAATKLLKKNNLSVSEISYACGFEDPGYFCKVFKRQFGKSPKTYQKKVSRPSRI